jgi:hypothetical protein
MAYLIFINNTENVENTIKYIAENSTDLNNLPLLDTLKVINISDADFLDVKLMKKRVIKYNADIITYENLNCSYPKKTDLEPLIKNITLNFTNTLSANPNTPFKDRINNYLSVLNAIDTNTFSYPLNSSLEKYLNDNGKIVLNHLQVA